MWLFTLNSFVSVVRHRDEPGKLLVRSRRRKDLVELLGTKMLKWLGPRWKKKIKEDLKADYRWRLIMPEKLFKAIVADYITKRLSYGNFKAAQKLDPIFSNFLHTVWDEGYRMQTGELRGDLWGKLRSYYPT